MQSYDLVTILIWLAGAGASVLASLLASHLFERWVWFQARTPGEKRAIVAATAGALALLAWAILTYVPPETLQALSVPFGVVASAIASYLGMQVFHAQTRSLR